MKSISKILVFGLLLIGSWVSAQNFVGEATYKTKRKLNIQLDSTKVNGEMRTQLMEMLKKQFEKTYKLTFNQEASIYKEEESLGLPNPTGAQVMMVRADGGDGELYKNTKEGRYVNQSELMGKIFLIKDVLEPHDWKLEKETKNIGDYTCFKATKTIEREKREDTMKVNEDPDFEIKNPETETITVTAWYTPQIPVNSGPALYFGLPGLILEVNDGEETTICSKIVLNSKRADQIVEPTSGKEVTQKEFETIAEEKLKEFQERNSYNRKKDGNNIEIRIGG